MSTLKIGRSHDARKDLFALGIRRGYLFLGEIDEALPSGSLTDAERWILFYSLQASRVEVRDSNGNRVDSDRYRRHAPGPEGGSEGEPAPEH